MVVVMVKLSPWIHFRRLNCFRLEFSAVFARVIWFVVRVVGVVCAHAQHQLKHGRCQWRKKCFNKMLRVLLLVFQCYFLSIISVIRKKQVSEQQTHYFLKGVFALFNHLAFFLFGLLCRTLLCITYWLYPLVNILCSTRIILYIPHATW